MTDLDKELSEKMKENRLRAIDNAIWYWNEKKKPNRFWWDEKEYSIEYCDSQIEYFEAMKKESN